MRGTLKIYYQLVNLFRITPAHAGNTILYFIFSQLLQDHPRPCGEHKLCFPWWMYLIGSPPPMRGTLVRARSLYGGGQDHPRPCGEHKSSFIVSSPLLGSPPPMRGTPSLFHAGTYPKRITPAHAGNTLKKS